MTAHKKLYVIMSEPPSATSQFVELEDENGAGVGPQGVEWTERPDGLWQLGPFAPMGRVYRVGEEPHDWKGDRVLGWLPPLDDNVRLYGVGEWTSVTWSLAVKAWTPVGDSFDGRPRSSVVILLHLNH